MPANLPPLGQCPNVGNPPNRLPYSARCNVCTTTLTFGPSRRFRLILLMLEARG